MGRNHKPLTEQKTAASLQWTRPHSTARKRLCCQQRSNTETGPLVMRMVTNRQTDGHRKKVPFPLRGAAKH